jgi:hypothetical protein
MAKLVYKNGLEKKITNLGWLLKNWKLIDRFELTKLAPMGPAGAILRAYIKESANPQLNHYETEWASFALALNWLARPVFLGVPISVHRDHRVLTTRVGEMQYEIQRQNPMVNLGEKEQEAAK